MKIPYMRARLAALVALAAFAIVAAACGSEDPTATPTQPPASTATPQSQPSPTPTPEPGEITVYVGRSESLVGPIIERFEQATGVRVRANYAGTGALAATLLEEGRNSPADVFFPQDPGALGAVADMLATLPDDILSKVPEWARSPEGKWVGISGRARTVVYNTNSVTPEDLPEGLEGFTDSRWQGKLGWAPTNGSFQAMVTGMRLLWGEQETEDWLRAIKALNPREYQNNTAVVQAAGDGEIDAGFVNHYYLFRFLAEQGESFPARNYFLPDGGPGSVVLVAGAGILDTARNRHGAELFLDYMLSAEAQQYFADETFEYPLVEGVQTNELLPDLETLNKPEIDISLLGDLEATQDLMRRAGVLP